MKCLKRRLIRAYSSVMCDTQLMVAAADLRIFFFIVRIYYIRAICFKTLAKQF